MANYGNRTLKIMGMLQTHTETEQKIVMSSKVYQGNQVQQNSNPSSSDFFSMFPVLSISNQEQPLLLDIPEITGPLFNNQAETPNANVGPENPSITASTTLNTEILYDCDQREIIINENVVISDFPLFSNDALFLQDNNIQYECDIAVTNILEPAEIINTKEIEEKDLLDDNNRLEAEKVHEEFLINYREQSQEHNENLSDYDPTDEAEKEKDPDYVPQDLFNSNYIEQTQKHNENSWDGEMEKETDLEDVPEPDNNQVETQEFDYVLDPELAEERQSETPKRNKRQFVDESKWNENKRKIHREKGKQYYGKRNINGKWIYDLNKEERKLQEPCNCKLSLRNTSVLKCRDFSEDERKTIFKTFWSEMTWPERKIYVSFLIESKNVMRHRNRKEESTSRRTESLVYFMKKGDIERVRVCKQMFLKAHCVKENMILDWLKKKKSGKGGLKVKEKEQEKTQPDRYQDMKLNLETFFNELPKVESHYCRSSSNKLYLEPTWKSKSSIYKFYKQWCHEKNYHFLSIASFGHVFVQMNLSIFRPKKDECDQCVAYRTKNLSDESFNLHQEKKKEAREEKSRDKESENKVFCMDLQSVLLAPKSNTSALYFKQKLMVHNFTFFDLKTKDGYCYLWHESAGGVSANDYASIICRFIKDIFDKIEPGQNVILYSDGCTSQNRNSTLANALINLSMTLGITIEQKFLEKGHTQMEADSIHSTIERKIRHTDINVPADYVNICMQAREKPRPYKVFYLDFDFFKDFQKLDFVRSIRPGKKVGDPCVTDLRALRYLPDSSLFYKLRHSEDFFELQYSRISKDKRKGSMCQTDQLPPLYKGPIPIKQEKYLQLQTLKKSITSDYHCFYDNLPFK